MKKNQQKNTQKNHNKTADPRTIRLMCSSAIILIQSTFATLACKQIRKQHHRSYCQFDIQWPKRKISTSLLMRDSLMEVDRKLRMTGIYQKLSLSQDDICSLNRIASECSNNLQTETTKLHDFTSSMKEQ
jgi:hypothetical protein